MNVIYLFVEIIVAFTAVVMAKRFFGKSGLYVWAGFATVAANVMTAKTVSLFGMDATLGTVLFASTFLVTDILTECYGKESAKTAVKLALLSACAFIVASQIALAYQPSEIDYANDSMKTLFEFNLRISAASVVMFFVANYLDVILYDKIRSRMNGKQMWIRNNLCTMLCNGLENFAFISLAFVGIYSWSDIFVIAGSTTIVEILVAICDTPFLYIARKMKNGQRTESSSGRV